MSFEKNILNAFGKPGAEWLSNLPRIIKSLEKLWGLSDVKALDKLNWNFVASAKQDNKSPVILKISYDQEPILNEYNALRHFDGRGAVRSLAFNYENKALLLEYVSPGVALSGDPEKIIPLYANLVRKISNLPLGMFAGEGLEEWLEAVDTISDSRIDPRFIKKARELKLKLLTSLKNTYLCHGDLHLENVISCGSNWVAIDPKAVIGEIEFEASAFDLVSPEELKSAAGVSGLILARINLLAASLKINSERLFEWIFLRNMLAAQWFIEDKGDPSFKIAILNLLYSLWYSDSKR